MNFETIYKSAMQKKAAGPGFGYETDPGRPKVTYGLRYGENELDPDLSNIDEDDWSFRISQYLKNRYYNTVKGLGRTVADIASFGNEDLYDAYRRWAQKHLPEYFTPEGTAYGMKPIIQMGRSPISIFTTKLNTKNNLQKAYDTTPANMRREGRTYYKKPDMPSGIYELALQEANKPAYNKYRRRGMSTEHIANMISMESYAPMLSELFGGQAWNNNTKLTDDQWKRWDQMYENWFTSRLAGKPGDERSDILADRNVLMDNFRKGYASMKDNIPKIRLQRNLERAKNV